MVSKASWRMGLATAMVGVLLGVTQAAEPFTLRFGSSGSLVIPMDPAHPLLAYQLGYRTDALPGYDAYDVPAPTTTPPGGGTPILYMVASDAAIGGYSQDFRPPSSSQVWELRLEGMDAGKSVVLSWRLQDGSLAGNPLSLIDRQTGSVLVADMTAVTSYTCTDTNRSLLVLYGAANHPPVARGDELFMLAEDGSILLPFDALLANDYDPDPSDTIEVVGVGLPHLPGSADGKAGTSAYGTTVLDAVNRRIEYSLPTVLPGDWTGSVAIVYTIQDGYLLDPRQSTATILLQVAPAVVQEPLPPQVSARPGAPVALDYMLRYSGSLHSLTLEYALPSIGSGAAITFWPFMDDYTDTDAATPNPVIDTGVGPDGIAGTADDTGMLRLDFGTNVPASGTRMQFSLMAPFGASPAVIASQALYRVTAGDPDEQQQRLAGVDIVILAKASFLAGANGTLTGVVEQFVEPGRTTTPVTAVPNLGYGFLHWTRGGVFFSAENPISLAMGSEDVDITAEFAINTYTLTFTPGANGTLTGQTTQTVAHGANAGPVTAVQNVGHHFVRWTRGGVLYSVANPLTVTSVTEGMDLVAEFAINVYVVTFLADPGGSLVGTAVQNIPHGGNATAVTAVPNPGFRFTEWSNGSKANPLTVVGVTAGLALTARFEAVVPVDPVGDFALQFRNPANPGGRLVFDFTGGYDAALGAYTLRLDLLHDEKGTVTGTGRLHGNMPGGAPVDVPLTVKGKAAAKNGATTLAVGLAGSNATSSAKLKLTLTRNAGNLEGAFSGSLADTVGGKEKLAGACQMPLVPGMTGQFALDVTLNMTPKGAIAGNGLMTLANGRQVVMLVKGKTKAGVTTLQFAGDKLVNPIFGAVKFKGNVQTLSDGTGEILLFSGKAFGQSLKWP